MFKRLKGFINTKKVTDPDFVGKEYGVDNE